MTEKVQTKFVFKNVFRTVDDWLKNKEHEITKEKDVENYMQDENDEIVFKNAYKDFDQYVNNIFSSDQSIKDYLRGRNQEQQKVYDSKFFKNVFSRSLEHQRIYQHINNNSPSQSPNAKKSPQLKILRPLNLKKIINSRSPGPNANISAATSYGSFREKGRSDDLFHKTSQFFQTTSKISKQSEPVVKVHKFKMQDSQIKSQSNIYQQNSLKSPSNVLKQGSLNSISINKEGSLNKASSKDLPVIELDASKYLEMQLPDEQTDMKDYLKNTAENLMKVENDIFNSHFLSSKTLFKDSAEIKDTNNNSETLLFQNSKRIQADPLQIQTKRVQNKQFHQTLNVNIYRLLNVLKEERKKNLKFNLRLPLVSISILNMLYEQTNDQLYKTLSEVVQKYIFCFDSDLTEMLSSHLKINFASKVYSYWELVSEACNLVETGKDQNDSQIKNLQSKIKKVEEEMNKLQKENEEYKNNIQTITKRCEAQFNNEKISILEQLNQKSKENSKLSDEIALYKKQIKTQEGIFLQSEKEMKMIAKQLELDFSANIQQMEKSMKDLNIQNTHQSNKIFLMQDSYATQLVRDRIIDLESKISLIVEENSRLNARAGTNFFELTPRPSFGSIDQIINPHAPILSQDIFIKNTQYVNFKQKSTQKKVEEKAKQIKQYVNNIKDSYENKIQELVSQHQVIQQAAEQKKKFKQQTKQNQKAQKELEKTIRMQNQQVIQSKKSIGAENEENQNRSANELQRINSHKKNPSLSNQVSISKEYDNSSQN